MLTLGADIKISYAHPVFRMATFLTDKAICPFLFKQIIAFGLENRKSISLFGKSSVIVKSVISVFLFQVLRLL